MAQRGMNQPFSFPNDFSPEQGRLGSYQDETTRIIEILNVVANGEIKILTHWIGKKRS